MSVRTVEPREAHALLAQGYSYLDVRSEVEFALGHVPGAFNVPLLHPQGDVLVTNPDFATTVSGVFTHDAQIIVGCHATSRAERACGVLTDAGYTALLRLQPGWDGTRDAFGRLIPGWSRLGLPNELGDGDERSYQALLRRH